MRMAVGVRCSRGHCIHHKHRIAVLRPETGTGPRPIRWPTDQAPPHRVGVDVGDGSIKRGRVGDVAIIPAASLPEVMPLARARRLARQVLEEVWLMLAQPSQRPPGDGLLERSLCLFDSHLGRTRVDQQVHVLGHDDVGEQGDVVLVSHGVQRFDRPSARAIASEQGPAAVAGEGQLMGVAGDVVNLSPFHASHDNGDASRFGTDKLRGLRLSVAPGTRHPAPGMQNG